MRVRGLKHRIYYGEQGRNLSHPMRVRGLKLCTGWLCANAAVAPHAGAWIETTIYDDISCLASVAPHAGAWIETLRYVLRCRYKASHPMRVRGLKL